MAKKHKVELTAGLDCVTSYTKTGVVNMHNRKPYRNALQKEEAKRLARKDSDGTWRSSAPKSYHSPPKGP